MPIVNSGVPVRGVFRRGGGGNGVNGGQPNGPHIDHPSRRHLPGSDVEDEDDEEQFYDDDDDDDMSPLSNKPEEIYGPSSPQSLSDTRKWDVFRNLPPEANSGSTANQKCLDLTVKCLKVVAYVITFSVVLICGMITKGTVLFMTSQIKPNQKLKYCNRELDKAKEYQVEIPDLERVAWIWCLFFAFAVPEFGTWFRSTRICMFKSWEAPHFFDFLITFIFETLHTAGLALLFFVVLPELDVVKAAMLTNCVCFLPALFGALSRNFGKEQTKSISTITKISVDVLAIVAQATGFIVWPWVEANQGGNAADPGKIWIVPIAVILTSCGWWENYVSRKSTFRFIKRMGLIKDRMRKTRYFTYMFISLWKLLFFFGSMLFLLYVGTGVAPRFLFKNFKDSFSSHLLNVTELNSNIITFGTPDIVDFQPFVEPIGVHSWGGSAAYVLLIQVLAAWLCYVFAKFACKICIQGFSFAFPVSLTVPVTISVLIALCGLRNDDSCLMESIVPAYLYWKCPQGDFLNQFISNQYAWIWLLWLLSQTWVTLHIWTPKCERLATTEKLFVTPMYCSLVIDQSLAMNRRLDEEGEVKTEDIPGIDDGGDEMSPYYETISVCTNSSGTEPAKKTKSSDHITRIYACATMWHETRDEMMEMLKSIFRMDEDQCARRVAQKYLKVVDPDYYEFETHILFDDAFEASEDGDGDNVINQFVKLLIELMDVAASHVHQTNIRIKPPKKLPAPYGGRLVWTLPGKTKIFCHLKNKDLIRTRKRWSQVMYMYYLLGHRLMELPISEERKSTIAENTYLLTLDGDIDFQPGAVQLLIDLMKKNKKLGAACGRIHPVGSGPMVWYQMFEYAIGHWLQKATEHMIGCVMCSPGCFSIFRGIALMDDNVMGKYTTKSDEARHYVQYDQGEDRWLCTLLLQRGYRVEYSAASDAYTHCPEGFSEFYNQRRRWAPSTMANIMDLLIDYKRTIKVNDSISFPYIIYQVMLLAGTILGPGTIFLMLVGAFVAAFRIDNWTSFTANIIPIMIFMAMCFVAPSKIQLILAQMMSAGYALVMMAVIVGTALQLGEDGIGSPSAIFLIALSGSFFIAACLHPQEFWCIVPGLLYLLLIPSMYLLLIIYSLVNLNNVSWGTREVLTKKTKAEVEREKKEAEEAQKKQRQKALLGVLSRNGGPEEDGSIEFSLAGLFKCMCCLYPKAIDEGQQLLKIADSLLAITKRLDSIEKIVDPHGNVIGKRRSFSRNSTRGGPGGAHDPLGTLTENDNEEEHFEENLTDDESERPEPKVQRENMINPFWLEDPVLRRSEPETLPGPEVQFWTELMEKYLYPIDADKEKQKVIAGHLKELRNRSVFYFFMCNAIFILIVFLLQLNKDNLHFKWPFGVKTNITYIEETSEAKIAEDLKELRNKSVFAFFMFNALFILIVFLLQLNKDQLHVDWPLGVRTNITYIEETAEPIITKEYLQLEPIGLVFVFFFALILIIQFTAMLFHRFGTLSHILASTELTCCSKKVDDNALDIEKSAVQIVKELQKLRDIDEDESEDGYNRTLGRRRTIHQLEKHRRHRNRQIGTLDVAFRKRFFAISKAGEGNETETPGAQMNSNIRKISSMRRETIKALDQRRKTVMGERADKGKHRMETLGAKRGEMMKARMAAEAEAAYHNGSLNGGIANRGYETDGAESRSELPGSLRLQNLMNPTRGDVSHIALP